jgi:hypothetical protein
MVSVTWHTLLLVPLARPSASWLASDAMDRQGLSEVYSTQSNSETILQPVKFADEAPIIENNAVRHIRGNPI